MTQRKQVVKLFIVFLMLLLYSSLVYAQATTQTRKDKALVIAAGKGELTKVKALLEQGANINGDSYTIGNNPLITAIEEGRVNVVEYLLKKGALLKPAALNSAVSNGDVKIVELLVRHGVDVNYTDEWGHNAIHWATINRIEHPTDKGHFDRNRRYDQVIQILKAAGAR